VCGFGNVEVYSSLDVLLWRRRRGWRGVATLWGGRRRGVSVTIAA